MMEGSGSGSVPLTNGSRSRRPKNLLIRIRNAGNTLKHCFHTTEVCSAWSSTLTNPWQWPTFITLTSTGMQFNFSLFVSLGFNNLNTENFNNLNMTKIQLLDPNLRLHRGNSVFWAFYPMTTKNICRSEWTHLKVEIPEYLNETVPKAGNF